MKAYSHIQFISESAKVQAGLSQKVRGLKRKLRFIRDAIALFRYMGDPDVHWSKKAIVVGALLYFIIPVDSIPDIVPIVGYLDDAGVVAIAVKYLGKQLKAYYV